MIGTSKNACFALLVLSCLQIPAMEFKAIITLIEIRLSIGAAHRLF